MPSKNLNYGFDFVDKNNSTLGFICKVINTVKISVNIFCYILFDCKIRFYIEE